MTGKGLSRSLALLAVLASAVFAVPAASGQQAAAACGVPPLGQPWGCDLRPDYPPAFRPSGGVVGTSLIMRKQNLYVPVWAAKRCQGTLNVCLGDLDCGGTAGSCSAGYCGNSGKGCAVDGDCGAGGTCTQGNTWGWQEQALRTYGHPIDPTQPFDREHANDSNIRWGFPGPTFYARTEILKDPTKPPDPRTNPPVSPGTRIKIDLFNYWEAQSYAEAMECIPATYRQCTNRVCSTTNTTVCTQNSDCPAGETCNSRSYCSDYAPCGGAAGPCGAPQPVPRTHPNCFHGERVTNLHLHGTHVSPQRPQDFVLLNLFPYDSTGVPSTPEYAVGEYQVDVNPLPWNQAPGTHYYHPHHHGSTSLQVQEGMAGTLIIEGPFDDWLAKLYGTTLRDRILVLQQISERDNFFTPGFPNYPPKTLVNGQATPVITMRPGEIQRWRFIGATTQASASLEIGFDPRIKEVRQIAQDGVQFAWENYDRQPLRDSEGTYKNFTISPGNRADFLVQAPAAPGVYTVNSRVFAPNLAPEVEETVIQVQPVLKRVPPTGALPADKPPVDQNGAPLLFTVRVEGQAQTMEFPVTQATDKACKSTPRPDRCWPATPPYLADLDKPTTPAREVKFRMDGNPGTQPSSFWINEHQYTPGCYRISMQRGATEDWTVSNVAGTPETTALLPHPFHIHINPFQVVRNADRRFTPPYIWQDTIGLPVPGTTDEEAGPIWNQKDAEKKCPLACQADNSTWNGEWTTTVENVQSVCGCEQKSASVALRQRYDDYTGAYVIHCHFLGHEDQGMMWNVQTVCDPASRNVFGRTRADGALDDCEQTSPALPACGAEPSPHH